MVRAVYFYNASKHLTKQGSLSYDSGTGKYTYSSTPATINQGDVGVTQIVVALPSGTFSGGMPLITFRTPKGYTSNALAMSTASWTIIEDSVETTYQVFYITMTINAWTFTAGRCGIMPGYLQSATFNALDLSFYTVADGVNNYEELDGDTYEQIYEALYSVFSDLAERVVALETLSSSNEENIAGMLDGTTEFTQILFPNGVMLRYNSTQTVLEQVLPDGTVGQINKEVWAGVRNEDSVILQNGYVGAINGVVGEQMSAIRTDITSDVIANKTLGVVTMDDGIAINAVGKLTLIGEVNDVPIANLINTGTTYAEGQFLWVGLGGKLTNVQPSKPKYQIICAIVLKVYGTTLNMFVMPRIMQKLGDLSNVVITSVANKEMLTYDSATQTWINRTCAEMDLPTLSGNNFFGGSNSFDDDLSLENNKIINVANGTDSKDAVNKGQVDALLAYKADLVGGLVPSSQLPSYVDNVIEVATYADLPTTGEAGKIYVVIADETSGGNTSTYRWATSVYVQITDTLSASEIKTLYESNSDTNAFTDDEKTKLASLLNGTYYYSKTEVDALLDSIKLIQGVEETSIEQLYDGDQIALSTLNEYELIIVESIVNDGENYSASAIFKASEVLPNINDQFDFYYRDTNYQTNLGNIGSGLIQFNNLASGTGTCYIKGIKYVDKETDNILLSNPTTESPSGTATTQKEANEEFVSEIADIKNGTTTVEKANKDSDGNIIVDTYETKTDALETKENVLKNTIAIDAIEETLSKQSGTDTSTADGTSIISLGKDVSPRTPLKVKMEGLYLKAPQLLSNPDFTLGTTGFTTSDSISVTDGIMKTTGIAGGATLITSQTTSEPYSSDKYYAIAKCRVTSSGSTELGLRFIGSSSAGSVSSILQTSPVTNTWYNVSNVFTVSYGSGFIIVQLYSGGYTDPTGATNEFDYVYLFNVQNLINAKQYSPIYKTTFDLMSDAQIKAQMDYWVLNGDLPSTNAKAMSFMNRHKSVGKNLFDGLLAIGAITDETGIDITSTINFRTVNYTKVKPSTTYYVSLSTNYQNTGLNVYFYDVNKVFISKSTTTGQNSYTTPANAYYIRVKGRRTDSSVISFSELSLILLQLELGSTATTYEPYISSEKFYNDTQLGYSLPNGIKDSVEERNGKAYHIKRIAKRVLISSDVTNLDTSYTNIDVVRIDKPSDFIYDGVSQTTSSGRSPYAQWINNYPAYDGTTYDDLANVGRILTNYYPNQWGIGVAKGTYANLAAAQAALTGTEILYQLATYVENEISTIGTLQAYQNGTDYIDNAIRNFGVYGTSATVSNASYPISSIEYIRKLNSDGSETELAVSSAVIAGDGLSFTHSGLTAGDNYYFVYFYTGDYIKGLTTLTYYDNPLIVADSVTGTVYKLVPSIASGVLTWTPTAI